MSLPISDHAPLFFLFIIVTNIESLAKHQYLLLIQITENNSAVIKSFPQSFAMFQVNLYSKTDWALPAQFFHCLLILQEEYCLISLWSKLRDSEFRMRDLMKTYLPYLLTFASSFFCRLLTE